MARRGLGTREVKQDKLTLGTKDDVQKRPFNKIQWREGKYSHKAKLKQFEEKRRKSVIYKYHKELQKSNINTKKTADGLETSLDQRVKRHNPYHLAKLEAERKAQEKELKHQKIELDKKSRFAALQKYQREKMRRNKILSKRTRKGQPVMAGRMELLLEKIQKSMN